MSDSCDKTNVTQHCPYRARIIEKPVKNRRHCRKMRKCCKPAFSPFLYNDMFSLVIFLTV